MPPSTPTILARKQNSLAYDAFSCYTCRRNSRSVLTSKGFPANQATTQANTDVLPTMPLGNLFPIEVEKGSVYEISAETANTLDFGDRIFWSQRHFTIQPIGRVLSEDELEISLVKAFVTKQFFSRLPVAGYRTRRERSEFGDLNTTAFKEDALVNRQHLDIVRLYRGFDARTLLVGDTIYLCVDPRVLVKSVGSIAHLISRGVALGGLLGLAVYFYDDGPGHPRSGYLLSAEDMVNGRVLDAGTGQQTEVPLDNVFPANRPEILRTVLALLGISYDIVREVRVASFLYRRDAPRHRLQRTLEIVQDLAAHVFPLEFGEFRAVLATEAAEVIFDGIEE